MVGGVRRRRRGTLDIGAAYPYTHIKVPYTIV